MSNFAYAVEENVLCFHGPLVYGAKIKKQEERQVNGIAEAFYFVHYNGWKATWDEWVPASRLLRNDAAGQATRQRLIDQKNASEGKELAAASRSTAKKITDASRKRPREGETEAEWVKRPEVKIAIPESLKVQLVDDWEAVTKNQQIVPLPRTPNVRSILEEYKTFAVGSIKSKFADKTASAKQEAILYEVLLGLQLYFDKCLGSNLLYRLERNQYTDLRKKYQPQASDDFEPSEYYGAEHFLRLFVNLPAFIAHTSMDADSVDTLRDHIADLLRWIVKEQGRLFTTEYETTSAAYQNVTRA